MNIDPKEPKKPDRDRFVLSKGHALLHFTPRWPSAGFFPVEDLKTLRKIGSYLQGHPNMNETPGVDMSTGSLGQGVSAACGMALGAKHSGKPINVYTILGDGEVEEGECWELSCSPPTISSPTSVSCWTATTSRSTAPPRRS